MAKKHKLKTNVVSTVDAHTITNEVNTADESENFTIEPDTLPYYKDAFKYKLIYIMVIDDEAHEGLLKIGEATLASTKGPTQLAPNCEDLNAAAHERIDQYTRTAMIKYKLLYSELALLCITVDDGTVMNKLFSDTDVHDVLARSGYRCQRFPDSGQNSEWYEVDLQTAINAIAAFKSGRNVLAPSEKSQGTASDIPVSTAKGTKKITLRQEQQAAVDKTLSAFRTKNRMLWHCKMRFGKTISAYELMRMAGFKKSIVVTHRPVVEKGWHEDHDKIFGVDSRHLFVSKAANIMTYEFDAAIDSENDRNLRRLVNSDASFVYFASMQDLRGAQRAGGKFDKNNAVFDLDWDFIIYDEAHEGTQTDLGQKVQELLETPKHGKSPKVLELSGTPYNRLSDFGEGENVFTWNYVDEQKRKREFAEEHPNDHNPYTALPELRIFTFELHGALDKYATVDAAFNFTEFFRTWTGDPARDHCAISDGAHIGDFVHEADVKNFLDLISTESPDSRYPFACDEWRDIFRHTFWIVPGVKEARALAILLGRHPVFKKFKVANVAGEGKQGEEDHEEPYDTALTKVQTAIKNNSHTITISCGRLTMGVTVPEWSAVMLLSGSANTSASGYMQTIFRVQSVGSVNGKQKTAAYVFDFAPDRTLKVLSEVHRLSADPSKQTDSDARNALCEFLNFCPVIAIDGTRMQPYDVAHLMRQLKRITVDKAIKSGFDDESIYKADTGLVMTDDDRITLKLLSDVVDGQARSRHQTEIVLNQQGLTPRELEQGERIEHKPERERTPQDRELLAKLRAQRDRRKKMIQLLRAVSIRLPMLIYGMKVELSDKIDFETLIDKIDRDSWVEFMPCGLGKDLFKQITRFYDEDVLIGAGLKIRQLARAADDLPPIERVKSITTLFASFRNPDKETVLTPWRVVNMHMGDTIGGCNFYAEGFTPEATLETPRWLDNGDVTAKIFDADCNAKILEMNSKSGLYPLYLACSFYRAQLARLGKKESELTLAESQQIWRDVLAENIFVLCKTDMATSITRRTLAGYHDWTVHAIFLPHLLDQIRNDTTGVKNKLTNPATWHLGQQEQRVAPVKGRGRASARGRVRQYEEGERLKFNAIVGNPPYQLTGASGGTNDAPIYQHFVKLANALEPDYISLIMPSRWFAGGRDHLLNEFRENMLKDKHIRKMFAYVDSSKVFSNVEIKGGLCYYLRDTSHDGKCEYTLITDNEQQTYMRDLDDFGDILIRDPVLSEIVKKVATLSADNATVATLISGDTPFGIPTNPRTSSRNGIVVYDKPTGDADTTLFYIEGGERKIGYVNANLITKNATDIKQHKVFVPKAYGAGETFPHQILGVPEYGNANSVCSQSYLYAMFDTEQKAHNFISYLRTKFLRVLVLGAKITQDAPSKVYRFVPIQDFTRSWTDEELYVKYNLTADEIDFIESTIKPME